MIAEFVSTSHPSLLNQIIYLFQRRPELITKAINHVLHEDQELRKDVVLDMYLDHQISLSKAAELLDMHVLEAREHFQALGIPLHIGAADIDEARAEVDAMRHWFATENTQE